MKALYTIIAAAAVLWTAAVPCAHAGGYLSNYGGGGGRYLTNYSGGAGLGRVLNAYSSGGYGGGYGYSVVNYGYSSGGGSPDTPHRATWDQYTRLRAEYEARTYSTPLCGAYFSRTANYCQQATTRWSPQ